MVDLSPLPILLATEQWRAAESLLRRVAESGAGSGSVCYNLFKVLDLQGRSRESLYWLEVALERDPGHIMAWRAMGAVRLDTGDPAGAEQAFSRAAESAPQDPDTWRVLMRLRLGLGLWESVLETLDHLPRDAETQAAAYRVASERRHHHADRLRARLLMSPQTRVDALDALTDVSRGSLPLRLPSSGFPFDA